MIKRIIISLILLSALHELPAQNSRTLYFMNLPQSRFLNPAFKPVDSLYLGLPVITGIGFSFNNNFINYSDVFIKDGSDITFRQPGYNPEPFLNKIKKINYIESEILVQLLGLAFKAWNGYVFIDINERISASAAIPGVLFDLALRGDKEFRGRSIDLSSVDGSTAWYHEAGIGYSRNLAPGLRAGVRAKILFGVLSMDIRNNYFSISVNQDFSSLIAIDAAASFIGPVSVMHNQYNDISGLQFAPGKIAEAVLLRGRKNPGLGIDAGVTYMFSDKIMLSAAITDIGFIRWRNNPSTIFISSNLNIGNASGFSGLDLSNTTSIAGATGREVIDSVKSLVKPIETHVPFTAFTPSTLNLAGNYRLTKHLDVGILSSTRLSGMQLHQSFTMSANINTGNFLVTSASYTIANRSSNNLGVGVAVKVSVFQFYVTSDRIPLRWNTANIDRNSFAVPARWQTADLRLGMNLLFAKHGKSKADDECRNMAEIKKHFPVKHKRWHRGL